ncbi:hypothetical protein GX888_00245 [Candidatus Dojkabacteria bacterium]|uniref:Uncharacterized protein n=1 Tax=Candidatus Dojkabacteria bacterium TaxID=2099670 RepID=A0A847VCH6_9BACT|nr:hypothetical protein [Candidatus Dojkabacteria bacterium]
MINTRKLLLVVTILLITTVSAISILGSRKDKREEVKGEQTVQRGCKPYITNMIPNVSYVGEEYIYIPRIVGCKIDEIDIELDGVSWLSVSEEGLISGVPDISDVGIHRVVLTVSSEGSVNKYVEYIIVE